ncbi:MAG: hypothetical protein M3348_18310, partial [Acidobacteriota bacterium]|nr:hypothetical protein [Acidobacteriota bacterium]
MNDCVITATLFNADGTPAAGKRLKIMLARRDRTAFYVPASGIAIGPTDESGAISFGLPRGATVRLEGSVYVGGQSLKNGVDYSIPDQTSANLED